ncbi:hypothetical protein ACHQM5_013733 [Ranunculus cassubicifolius]
MSRPMVLVCLLVILIITSQFEWKQQLVNDQEIHSISQKHVSPREEVVKEKIILSQEKRIQKLNKLIQNLREQLVQCQGGSNDTAYGTTNLLSGSNKKLLDQQQQILLDD